VARHLLESSALAKRYVSETGSAWVSALLNPTVGQTIYLARITGVEVVSAITRRQRAGSLSLIQLAALLTQFRTDFDNDFKIVEVTDALIRTAMNLAETYALRGFDAVQLAAALQVHSECILVAEPFSLVSADTALNAAAITEGLSVDDPNSHP
jgi:predicted nucleic acid-binding protein